MKQLVFEQRNARVWQSLEATLEDLESSKRQDISEAGLKSFVADYKQVCSLYSLAKTRQYSPVLLARLHSL
ncbi:MAG: stage II sporulation protein M, partial [Gammaproteobacteria bacterium]|nr:stage II sporulation protein M [Gammaproteobacteria bacterium]